MPQLNFALPAYYIISSAEATSNLGRYDGIKCTTRKDSAQTIDELYSASRTEGFGEEVKRRIMLGNYVLSKENYEEYFIKAKKVQQSISKEFNKIFEICDVVISPTTNSEAFKFGEKTSKLVDAYSEDIFTAVASVAKTPAISIPYDIGGNELPLGLQIIAKSLNEKTMYQVANFVEKTYQGGKNE